MHKNTGEAWQRVARGFQDLNERLESICFLVLAEPTNNYFNNHQCQVLCNQNFVHPKQTLT